MTAADKIDATHQLKAVLKMELPKAGFMTRFDSLVETLAANLVRRGVTLTTDDFLRPRP